jgi:hypothetical protein
MAEEGKTAGRRRFFACLEENLPVTNDCGLGIKAVGKQWWRVENKCSWRTHQQHHISTYFAPAAFTFPCVEEKNGNHSSYFHRSRIKVFAFLLSRAFYLLSSANKYKKKLPLLCLPIFQHTSGGSFPFYFFEISSFSFLETRAPSYIRWLPLLYPSYQDKDGKRQAPLKSGLGQFKEEPGHDVPAFFLNITYIWAPTCIDSYVSPPTPTSYSLIPVFDHYTPQSFKLHLILSCR